MGLRDAIHLFISCSEKFSQLFFTVGRSTLISDDPSKPGGHQYLAMFISFLFLSTRIQMLKHPHSQNLKQMSKQFSWKSKGTPQCQPPSQEELSL